MSGWRTLARGGRSSPSWSPLIVHWHDPDRLPDPERHRRRHEAARGRLHVASPVGAGAALSVGIHGAHKAAGKKRGIATGRVPLGLPSPTLRRPSATRRRRHRSRRSRTAWAQPLRCPTISNAAPRREGHHQGRGVAHGVSHQPPLRHRFRQGGRANWQPEQPQASLWMRRPPARAKTPGNQPASASV